MQDVLLAACADPASYPLWAMFSPAVLKQTGSFGTSLTSVRTLDGEPYAPVFTDKDLALRFIEENRAGGLELMPVENLERLRYILGIYRDKGVAHVGTDFSTKRLHEFPQLGQLRTIDLFLRQTGGS